MKCKQYFRVKISTGVLGATGQAQNTFGIKGIVGITLGWLCLLLQFMYSSPALQGPGVDVGPAVQHDQCRLGLK